MPFQLVNVSSSVYMQKVIVELTPYNTKFDELSFKAGITGLQSPLAGNFQLSYVKYRSFWRMEVSCPGSFKKELSDWTYAVKNVVYRLNTDKLPPRACDMFVGGKYPRTVTLYVEDRFGRQSNKISKYIDIKTGMGFVMSFLLFRLCLIVSSPSYLFLAGTIATITYSNDKPVKITNSQPYYKLVMKDNIDPSYYSQYFNATATEYSAENSGNEL